jgi:TetR/AcrR family transcriptional regulator
MATRTRRAVGDAPGTKGARRILNAAARSFARRGYSGTSMADVAESAGVSKATVFHHFRSKRGLYRALIEQSVSGFREDVLPKLDTEAPLPGGLERFAAAHYARLTRHKATSRLILHEMLAGNPEFVEAMSHGVMADNFALLAAELRRGQANGAIRADVDPGLAVFMLLCASWFLFQAGELARRAPDLSIAADPDLYARQVADLLYFGLKPREASSRKAGKR